MKSMGIFCGSSAGFEGAYVPAAEALGTLVAERGLTVIYGGASIGLMGCVADAALRAGGQVIGVIPNSLQISEITHHDLTDLEIVDTMFQRKERMIELVHGLQAALAEDIETLDWMTADTKEQALIKLKGISNKIGYPDEW